MAGRGAQKEEEKADSSLFYAGCKYSPHPSLGMTTLFCGA
jgi:hypothetical protein